MAVSQPRHYEETAGLTIFDFGIFELRDVLKIAINQPMDALF